MKTVNKRKRTLKKGGGCGCSKTTSLFEGGGIGFSTPPTSVGSVPGYSYNDRQNDPLSPNNIVNSRLTPTMKINGGKKNKTSKRRNKRKRTIKQKRKTKGGSFLNTLAGFASGTSNYYTSNPTNIPVGTPGNQPHATIISGDKNFRTF